MYLVWLDFRELNVDEKEFNQLLVDQGIALNPGFWFGEAGSSFLRMNIATTKDVIEEGLEKLRKAVNLVTTKESARCC